MGSAMRTTITTALAFVCLTSSALAGGVSVPMDEVRTVTFGKPVTTVYVGNPSIADINIIDARHAFILGKSYGTTNIIALDAQGHQVSNTFVSVAAAATASTVTLVKGTTQQTLACNGQRCEPAPRPGDSNFAALTGDIEKHFDLGAKGAQ